jgi:hypothetical protein
MAYPLDPNDPLAAQTRANGTYADPPDILNHPAADVPLPGESMFGEYARGEDGGPVTSPGQVDSAFINPSSTPTPAPSSYSTKTGVKVKSDYRGMTEEGLSRAKRVMDPIDSRTNARMAEERDFMQGQLDKSRQHYGDVAEAQRQAAELESAYHQRAGEIQQQEMDFNKGAAELEQRLAGESQADRAQYITAYKEQLAVVRQLALQSGNPMGQLNQGQIAGLAGAQFAQGFLAAQGINIDVAGQVDKWVDRSIQEHQMKISNMRESAQDQLHLYEIARQNSQDEWEARQRYRGFVIAGLQSSIALNASRFGSDIAMARANEQAARLQVEADTIERSIGEKFFESRRTVYGQELDRAYKMGMLSIERKKAEAELLRAQAADKKAEAESKQKVDDRDFTVQDIEYVKNPDGTDFKDANGNRIQQVRWRLKPEIMADPDLARKTYMGLLEAREDAANYDDATREMIEAHAKATAARDKLWGPLKVTWEQAARTSSDPAIRDFIQARDNWVQARVLAISGRAATDTERQQIAKQAYADKFFDTNTSEKADVSYARLRKEGLARFTHAMEGTTVEIPEGDPARIGRSIQAAPRTKAQADATQSGVKPQHGVVDKFEGGTYDRGSFDVVRDKPSGVFAQYQRDVQIPQANESGQKIPLGQPEYAVQIERIVAAYVKPHYVLRNSKTWGWKDGDKEETAAELRRDGYAALDRLARGIADGGKSIPADVQAYASFVKTKIDNDPVLSKLDHDEDVNDAPLLSEFDSD